MPSSYTNNLRLEEIATGEKSGTWGDITNTNLELIAAAMGYGEETIADSDTTITMADGAADEVRSMYLKVLSSADLTATRTITLAPNTVSKFWLIENGTTGSQSITISQGSGTNVTIPSGETRAIVTDGAGSAANVIDAFGSLVFDTFTVNGLTVNGDSTLDGDVTLTGASFNAVWDKSDSSLEFADNAKAVFGTGSDLQIYHDGSHSYIDEAGTGDIYVSVLDDIIFRTYGTNELVARFNTNQSTGGWARLYHRGSEKLETTSTGVDITDNLNVTNATGMGTLEVFGTDTDLSGAIYIGNQLNQGGMVAFGTDTDEDAAFVRYDTGSKTMCFKVDSSKEILSLDNEGRAGIARVQLGACTVTGGTGTDYADVLVNSSSQPTSSNATSGFIYNNTTGMSVLEISAGSTSSSRTHAEFINTNGTVGSITTSGSATAFNTSSDYRLKQDVSYDWDATEKLLQLKPATFAFKADPSTRVEGFMAHELQEHLPNAVTGEKDGEEMQSVDHSKIVPLLVKTIQELEARIAELENARS